MLPGLFAGNQQSSKIWIGFGNATVDFFYHSHPMPKKTDA